MVISRCPGQISSQAHSECKSKSLTPEPTTFVSDWLFNDALSVGTELLVGCIMTSVSTRYTVLKKGLQAVMGYSTLLNEQKKNPSEIWASQCLDEDLM
jgi:hypothetical protein